MLMSCVSSYQASLLMSIVVMMDFILSTCVSGSCHVLTLPYNTPELLHIGKFSIFEDPSL